MAVASPYINNLNYLSCLIESLAAFYFYLTRMKRTAYFMNNVVGSSMFMDKFYEFKGF